MSKIGKKPVSISAGIDVNVREDVIEIKGKDAALTIPILEGIKVEKKSDQIVFIPQNGAKQTLSNWGTMRSLVQNAVLGITKNFTKTLIIEGVGYRANLEGKELVLNLGYSHSIRFPLPESVRVTIEKSSINITGPDKAIVGETAARIRKLRKPEPYKGKGIRYSNETIRRKIGKRAIGKTG